jgi:hypothetical protein
MPSVSLAPVFSRLSEKPICKIHWILGANQVIGGIRIAQIQVIQELVHRAPFRLSRGGYPPGLAQHAFSYPIVVGPLLSPGHLLERNFVALGDPTANVC